MSPIDSNLSHSSESNPREVAFSSLFNAASLPFFLVLGSRSPRRRLLLSNAGLKFAVLPADDDAEKNENVADLEPSELVSRLAYVKARDVVKRLQRGVQPEFFEGLTNSNFKNENGLFQNEKVALPFVVVSCDSVAVCDSEILGKPLDRADAARMLRKLSGSFHEVQTGLCLWSANGEILRRVETSRLEMEPLSEQRLEDYLESGLWRGKAGAFGYQDENDWLRLISGSESNVVGLPLEAFFESLREMKRRFENEQESEEKSF